MYHDRASRMLVAALVVGALIAAPTTSEASEQALTLRARTSSITALRPIVLENSTRSIRAGERLPDGSCLFTGDGQLLPGQSLTDIEVAFDPDTCRSLGYERGVAYFRWQWRKDGFCSGLLRFNQKHQNVRIS